MKVVVDTNVLVAGLLSVTGPPGWIVEAALEGRIEPVFDLTILQEYAELIEGLLAAFDDFGFRITGAPPWSAELPDPDDAPFLAVAAATGSVLVTGNVRHFPPSQRHGVVVMTPRQFVNRFEAD